MGSFIPFISYLQIINQHYLETKTILHVPPNNKACNNKSDEDSCTLSYKCCGTGFKNVCAHGKPQTSQTHPASLECGICCKLIIEEEILEHQTETNKRIEKKWKCKETSQNEMTEENIERGPYKCCGFEFKYISKLKEHQNTLAHQGLEVCKICQKLFKSEEILKHRAEIHQYVEGKWKCESCHMLFSTNGDLTQHIKAQQAKSDLYKCTICQETFTMKCAHTLHRKSHVYQESDGELLSHKSEKGRLKCCGIEFKALCALETHQRTYAHRGLEKCLICHEVFKKEEFLKHRAEIHQEVEGKWKCEGLCGRRFVLPRRCIEEESTKIT
ncbi:Zinc finger protein 58 [Frankliniella fusca]|uniref:Zinc finger protein 58 n=1 Tax=Frankliniella fusca TaxID=407009 RepID=A0AAE1H6Q7_9NEOP|nr:Zinc finger protein 58 [Frankliniella fusca]